MKVSNKLYNDEELDQYVQAMSKWCEDRGFKLYLCINRRFIENWTSVDADNDNFDQKRADEFYEFQSNWLKENGYDEDILIISFIKNPKYKAFVNDDS
jgi:hypothetical protein